MTEVTCVHCGQSHPASTPFCPNTGKPLRAAADLPVPGAAGHAVHEPPPPRVTASAPIQAAPAETPAATATGTAAESAVPARDAAIPISASASGAGTATGAGKDLGVLDLLQQAAGLYRREPRVALAAAAMALVPGALAHAWARATVFGPRTSAAVTGLVFYGLTVPLAQAALALWTADRVLGGRATWRQIWGQLAQRAGALLPVILLAAPLVALGFFLLYLPGAAIALAFVYAPLVAAIDGMGGPTALRRSVQLVRADWLRPTLLLLSVALLRLVAAILAGFLLPDSLFGWQVTQDLLTLLLLPIPLAASALLYLDLRRKRDGLDDTQLRATLPTAHSRLSMRPK